MKWSNIRARLQANILARLQTNTRARLYTKTKACSWCSTMNKGFSGFALAFALKLWWKTNKRGQRPKEGNKTNGILGRKGDITLNKVISINRSSLRHIDGTKCRVKSCLRAMLHQKSSFSKSCTGKHHLSFRAVFNCVSKVITSLLCYALDLCWLTKFAPPIVPWSHVFSCVEF